MDYSGQKIVGIFAHPDDESFGPGGTLAKLAQNNEVYIICVTGGEAGQNETKASKQLSEIRKDELRNASKILGVKQRYCLNFKDGTLSNNKYHKIADEIEKILENVNPDILITFAQNGVSGHLDHIAVSMITTYIFKRSKQFKKLFYYGIIEERREKYLDDYFVYFPEGYKKSEMDLEVDITSTFEKKIEAIKCHKSQKKDVDLIIESLYKMPKKEYFMLKEISSF